MCVCVCVCVCVHFCTQLVIVHYTIKSKQTHTKRYTTHTPVLYMYMHATCRQRTGTHGELSSVGVKADVNCVLKVDRSGYFRPVLDCRVEGGRGGEGGEGEGGGHENNTCK